MHENMCLCSENVLVYTCFYTFSAHLILLLDPPLHHGPASVWYIVRPFTFVPLVLVLVPVG